VEEGFLYSDVVEGLANNAGQKEVVMGKFGRIVEVCEANMIVDVGGRGVRNGVAYCDLAEGNIFAQARVMIAFVSWGRHKAGRG
jgi:hypothetical protein